MKLKNLWSQIGIMRWPLNIELISLVYKHKLITIHQISNVKIFNNKM